MRKYGILVSIFIVLLSTSCATMLFKPYQDKMDTWIGKSSDQLFIVYGPPNASQKLSDGKTVVSYSFSDVEGTKGDTNTWYCKLTFVIENDKIIKWNWDGNLGGMQAYVKAAQY